MRKSTPPMKSTPAEIEARFDADVERFSDLDAGQATIPGSALAQSLLVAVAVRHDPHPRSVLDLGCGAGNLTLRLLAALAEPPDRVRLVDLSRPMLDRATERLREAGYAGTIEAAKGDLRRTDLGEGHDVVLAAAVLHHLRGEREWRETLARLHRALRPGGLLLVHDMVAATIPAAATIVAERYGAHLAALRDEAYRDAVLASIAREDSPEPLGAQIAWLGEAGFRSVDVLHALDGFAATASLA